MLRPLGGSACLAFRGLLGLLSVDAPPFGGYARLRHWLKERRLARKLHLACMKQQLRHVYRNSRCRELFCPFCPDPVIVRVYGSR